MAKRTTQEIYNIICEKKKNALNDLEREQQRIKKLYSGDPQEWNSIIDGVGYELNYKINCLLGQIDAYTDVLILIETSGVL